MGLFVHFVDKYKKNIKKSKKNIKTHRPIYRVAVQLKMMY